MKFEMKTALLCEQCGKPIRVILSVGNTEEKPRELCKAELYCENNNCSFNPVKDITDAFEDMLYLKFFKPMFS